MKINQRNKILFLVLAAILLLLPACSGGSTEPAVTAVSFGDTFSFDGLTCTVGDADEVTLAILEKDQQTPEAANSQIQLSGNIFFYVPITIENKTSSDIEPGFNNLECSSPEENPTELSEYVWNTVAAHRDLIFTDDISFIESVAAGETIESKLYFLHGEDGTYSCTLTSGDTRIDLTIPFTDADAVRPEGYMGT